MSPRQAVARAALLIAATMVVVGGLGSSAARAGAKPASRGRALEKENATLRQRLQALEEENRALRAKASAAPVAAPATQPLEPQAAPLDVTRVDPKRADLEFFNLGVKRDYLKAERWRIVEQIQQFIPPLYEPVLPFHGYTLPPGAMRFKVSTSLFNNTHDFGSDDSYSLFFDKLSVRNLVVNYDLFYGFELPTELGKDLVINLNVPYKRTNIRGTGHPFNIEPFVMSMNGDSEGIGDISFTIKKKWLDQGSWPRWLSHYEGSMPFNLATFTGLITPTGKHNETFNAAQSLTVDGRPMPALPIDVFSAKPGQTLLPIGVQPGTGAWGFRIGAAVTRQFERSALHAGLISNLYTKNSEGITPGNEINFGLSYVFPPLKADWLSVDLSIFGRHQSDEEYPGLITHPERNPATGGPFMNSDGSLEMFITGRPNFKHGTVMFASPSLIIVPIPQARILISPAFRILEPTQGPSPAFMLTAGAEFTFAVPEFGL